ncbi:MAG: LUD domain-containing protein [Fimbriimonadaceae bacterium]|nr:LUD domain-containing protein [Fimbriimonadaceae bacterium]
MKRPPIVEASAEMPTSTRRAVGKSAAHYTAARVGALPSVFDDPEAARTRAAEIKQGVLDHLPDLLEQLEAACIASGIRVHHAQDAAEARRLVIEICRAASPAGGVVAKAKSMATEEIGLNAALEEAGFEPVETDLGEFVVQIDHDHPSHIVAPIIHKTKEDVARSFAREGLGEYTEDPEALTKQARAHLRGKFRSAAIGVSGVNFAIAETGRLALVENEGNNRLSTTAPDVHIAVMGIEKILPTEEDLALFLPLLAASATGQSITTYVHFVSGPKRGDEPDGPREVHLVLLDNGRSKVLAGPYQRILLCIRCGACLNVCPVYRQVSGHAYGHVYPGPLGAVLVPAMEGVEQFGHLAKASSLCGACEEVCPVKIPIPEMLLRLRAESKGDSWAAFAAGATHPSLWRSGLRLLPMAPKVGPLKAWSEFREPPRREGREFRKWWHSRSPVTPARSVEREPSVEHAAPRESQQEGASDAEALWARFQAQLEKLQGRIASLKELERLAGPWWVDGDAAERCPWTSTTDDVWEANVGVSLAVCAIAETGSVVLESGPAKTRLGALAPPVHVILVPQAQIVATLAEGIARMSARTSVIATGPSRTADIGGHLIRGVHGPGEVIVVRI